MKPIQSIILIDDDNIFNFINEKTIHEASFAVNIKAYLSAQNALNELYDIIHRAPHNFPEAIFLDINMPHMDGWEFLDEYRKLPKTVVGNCKIYMLTSSINPDDFIRAAGYSMVDDFISKPLDIEKLSRLKEKIRGGVN